MLHACTLFAFGEGFPSMLSPLLPRVAQASYLTWGYLQEKVVTTELPHPHPNPDPDPSTLALTRAP